MALLSLQNLSFTWGHPPLLDQINLEVETGEKIALVGRNGAGKSTLMKVISGQIVPDSGDVKRAKNLEVAYLVQEVPTDETGRRTIGDFVTEGYHAGQQDQAEDWQAEQAVKRVLSRMNLDAQATFASLSSGMKRRVLLASALVRDPKILLLDEPTNHLDVDSIRWLEQFLQSFEGTVIFVTHDRVFLQSLATRIIEVDRGKLYDWTCDYQTFLQRKAAALEAEEKQNALFDKKLAQEEAWIRQGIKARRTRNEGRVRALKVMREERRQRRQRTGNVRMQVEEAEKSGQLVIQAKNISFSYGDRPIVNDFSTIISREDRVGIIGPNGSGKTTLLKLLLGELEPSQGTIKHGTKLEVVYFDQLREQLDEEQTVLECVSDDQDSVEINGKKRHIYGYLQEFLFEPDRARRQVKFLSGGERNRLLLAKLFKRPSNVLVLDEPTNDLDMETLELLEELVANYAGTVMVVSHDRAFLNNVVTSTLVYEENGVIKEYFGGYDDYLKQSQKEIEAQQQTAKPRAEKKTSEPKSPKPAKLSYKEKRELESLPQQIEQLETEQAQLHAAMADPSFFKKSGDEIAQATQRLAVIDEELAGLFERWEDLESRA